MKNIVITTWVFLTLILCFPNAEAQQNYKHKYQNPNLSIEERVDDLISNMTLEEKVGQLMYNAPSIDRLDVPQYNWWNECLHGVARNGRATVFSSQAIGMAATFDTDLMHRIGKAISMEARAKYNVSVANNLERAVSGTYFLDP